MTSLSLTVITLGTPDVKAAHGFYSSVFSPAVSDYGEYVDLDMHGAGHIGLLGAGALAREAEVEPASSGFRGYVLSCVVRQPSEVKALAAAAAQGGAEVLKPAKKAVFGSFSATLRPADGSIWKISAEEKKDQGPGDHPPVPTETAALLGVRDAKRSKTFYEALGMAVDRDYGSKYVDFKVADGTSRLGLMPRKALAKDVGVKEEGSGFSGVVLHHRAEKPEEVDTIVQRAASAGGQVAVEPAATQWGGYSAHLADLDGFLWKIASA